MNALGCSGAAVPASSGGEPRDVMLSLGTMTSTSFTNPPGRAKARASAYVRSILALLGDRDPIVVQSRLVRSIRSAIRGLPGRALERPEARGKWSIMQVIRHLADSEVVFGWRLRLVLAEDRPRVTPFDQDAWMERLAGAYPDLDAALATLAVLRAANVALMRSLSKPQWLRIGLHSERGPESVRQMARLYAGHDLVHVNQIRRIRKAIGR